MNREVSENRIFLTKLFVLCGVIMGYDCWINHNRCWWLVFYLTGDIFKCVRVIQISRKQHNILEVEKNITSLLYCKNTNETFLL